MRRFIAPLAFLLLAGCGSGGRSDSDDSTLGALGSGNDIRATNCEIFVDRVIATGGSHGGKRITVFIKTLNDRLDGPIERVGFYRKEDATPCTQMPERTSMSCADSGKWKDITLQAFVGSSDYFELPLTIGGDYMPFSSYDGAFYVKTTNGTKYWANTKEGGNFVIDRNMFSNLEQMGHGGYVPDPQRAAVTADRFPYLNPGTCR
jgi:hypothetical protein